MTREPNRSPRKSKSEDDGCDARLKPGHTFRDPGEPIDAANFQPEARCVPEYVFARVCLTERIDFGGPLSEIDQARLAQMAIALAETSAALSKRAQYRDAEKAARIIREAKAPAPEKAKVEKAKVERACLTCEAVFLTDRSTRKFCTPICGRRWKKRAGRARRQLAGEAARAPATQTRPAETDAQAARAATGNWAGRLRDMAAAARATFQQSAE
jgi:hypothetical protein